MGESGQGLAGRRFHRLAISSWSCWSSSSETLMLYFLSSDCANRYAASDTPAFCYWSEPTSHTSAHYPWQPYYPSSLPKSATRPEMHAWLHTFPAQHACQMLLSKCLNDAYLAKLGSHQLCVSYFSSFWIQLNNCFFLFNDKYIIWVLI